MFSLRHQVDLISSHGGIGYSNIDVGCLSVAKLLLAGVMVCNGSLMIGSVAGDSFLHCLCEVIKNREFVVMFTALQQE